MSRKVKFESFKYRFLIAAQDSSCINLHPVGNVTWQEFIHGIEFTYCAGKVDISWHQPATGSLVVDLSEPSLYLRGDSDRGVTRQKELGLMDGEDGIKLQNQAYFAGIARQVAAAAGFVAAEGATDGEDARICKEREFHDAWAESEDISGIDVRACNEACTAPEMRYIVQRLGDLRGKRMLDVGCGLGEASVYFALLGADVTSSDLSQGMLDATTRLATANGVSVRQHIASAEDMRLPPDSKFDVIYAGNLLHHVDVEKTIMRIKPHLADNGLFVTWDPLAYNPAINVYRAMASDVRTPDEHPLRWSDIKLFRKHFKSVETRYFWLTTLSIFIVMALVQRRDVNEERFWKAVVKEGSQWAWLYWPLEKLDRLLIAVLPPLRLLCWNVVIVSRLA